MTDPIYDDAVDTRADGAMAKFAPIQRRAVETRAALLAGVEAVVAADGADAVTTTRIAQQSGVAVGTIYRYFTDRNELLLAAYDATVIRIVDACAGAMADIPPETSPADAARALLARYLTTADSIPGHAGLLKAMRAIRPIEADQSGNNEVTIVGGLLMPFWSRYAGGTAPDPARLHFLGILLGTLVDLYLMTPDGPERIALRAEIDAHLQLALERALV